MGIHADDLIDAGFDDWAFEGRYKVSRYKYKSQPEFREIPFNEIIKQTDKAWLLGFDKGIDEWFPKSKCTIEGKIVKCPEWLAKKKKVE